MDVIASERRASAAILDTKRWSAVLRTVIPLIALVTVGASCQQGIPKNVADRLKPVTLVWWGVNETEQDVVAFTSEYQRLHPNVSVR